jgi:NAD(P)-dependent dehydrogenase (short-subunit alcohol dehydrogenase family)
MITGATSGIGQEVARQLALGGSEVLLVGRDQAKAKATADLIAAQTGGKPPDYLLADLSSLAEVRALAEETKARYDRLDVLINNAGATFLRRQESVDGYEMTFAVNHLAPFLLTNLLLPLLQKSADGRIIAVASDAHEGATIDFDDLQSERDYSIMGAYGRSKLANIMFTYELARRLVDTTVTANALHPGFVSTGMGTNNVPSWFGKLFRGFTSLIARDVSQGAETAVYLAAAPEMKGQSGGYYVDKTAVSSSAVSYDEAVQQHLWLVSAQMANLSLTA